MTIGFVLHGKAQLSPEQGERVSRFLKHTPDEMQFFMLLIHLDRAGTEDLRSFYREQIGQILERRLNVVKRLGENNKLSDEEKAIFYSSWQYLAIQMALTVPALRTREALSTHFQIPLKRVDLILEFLLRTGPALKVENTFQVNTSEIRLGRDSPHIFRHHTHWRQQAIESLESEEMSDLHYSGVVTLSRDDVLRLKDQMLEHIKSTIETIRDSKEEEVYVFNTDFFKLQKSKA